MNKKLHVRKGDNVIVLSGKDKGKKGKVLSVMPKSGKVIVEGVAMATKHKKPRSQADVGGILLCALFNPSLTQVGQPSFQIYVDVWVAIRT